MASPPMKVMNSKHHKLGIEPFDITLRDKLDVSINIDKMNNLPEIIEKNMRKDPEKYRISIESKVTKYLFYPGISGDAAGKYIISRF